MMLQKEEIITEKEIQGKTNISRVYGSTFEYKLRNTVTKFGQLPMILLVVLLFAIYHFAVTRGFSNGREKAALDINQYISGEYVYAGTSGMQYPFLSMNWIVDTGRLVISLLFAYVFGTFTKLTFFKQRPRVQIYKNLRQRLDAGSFPSIHAINAFLFLYFASSVSFGMPAHTYIIIGIACWFLLSQLISLSRIVLKKHYPIDLIGGILYGILIVYLITYYGIYVDASVAYFLKPILTFLFA